ncbi:MAG: phenylacetate--CoA ligase family protein [Bacteroidetes bacterium]|jgi:phenylacetate-CoA ligase|nr:phenylacetate--CoA ligase family protein [Bacteroidota bacterium]
MIFKGDICSINYWRTRLTLASHEKIVKNHIEELQQYHQANQKADFTFVKEKLLTDILKYARKHSPYYRNILRETKRISSDTIKGLPFLTKELIRENEQAIKSTIVPTNLLLRRKTGGSTGEPLAFWSIGNTELPHQSFLFKLFGYIEGDKILAMDGTFIEEDLIENKIYWKVKNDGNMLPYGGMALSSMYLNKKNINEYLNFIIGFRPDFIRGYPAFISEIAAFVINNNIDINFRIKAIEVTSELCTESQANLISKAFKAKVIGQYGHTEACVFGYTIDDTMTYYCSPLYGWTEIIDDDDSHVDLGHEGEIVVTGFSSFGFPLIRYRTGDRAIYGGTKNGIVILNKVLGRTADYVVGYENEKVLLTALVFGQHYNAFSRINRWQIIQDLPGIVKIIIDKSNEFTLKDEEEISKTFYKVGKVKVEFDYGYNFIKTKAGKMKFVVQNIGINVN